jgi:hypothetical protein
VGSCHSARVLSHFDITIGAAGLPKEILEINSFARKSLLGSSCVLDGKVSSGSVVLLVISSW